MTVTVRSKGILFRALHKLLDLSFETKLLVSTRNYNSSMQNCYRVSQLFQPVNIVPHSSVNNSKPNTNIESINEPEKGIDSDLSKSSKLLVDNGIVKCVYPGNFVYLPLGIRVLEKLTRIVDKCMLQIGGQKILLPTLTQKDLWKKTGRYEKMKSEILSTIDRHGQFLMFSPTHEEAVTHIVSTLSPLSYKTLPLRMYQISSKFRDEMKPRFGLLRSREFIMKDLYTFDTDVEAAKETYNEIIDAYSKLFRDLGVPWRRVTADCGDIGGLESHEFHFPAAIGQDSILVCSNCETGINIESIEQNGPERCPGCGERLVLSKGIEVAHAFFLSDTYSSKLNATYIGSNNKEYHLQMGCFGVGVSRLIGACVEVLSTENELRWPKVIAPFSVCLIGPKGGSRESSAMSQVHELYDHLNCRGGLFEDDVILDDRDKMTVGKKLRDACKLGYTYIVLFGKNCIDKSCPEVELHRPMPTVKGENIETQVTRVPLAEIKSVLADLSFDTIKTDSC